MEVLALILITFTVIMLQSVIFNRMAFKNLGYICRFSTAEANEGDEIFLVETVQNRKMLPVPWLKVDINSSCWLDFAGTRSVVAQENRYVTSSFFLKSYQKITRRWKLKCLKRGVFSVENVTLVAGDLMGRKVSSVPVRIDARLMVYPQTVDIEGMFVPVNYLQGDTIVTRWIIDDPFIVSGARDYTPRDPMNRVHWGATARTGHLMVKQNDYTSQFGLTVILNIQSVENEYFHSVDKDCIELGIKVAATLFDRVLRNGIPARFATNASTIDGNRQMVFTREASGREHISELMRILAKLELKRIKDFEDYIMEIAPDVEKSDVVLITAYLTENICDTLRSIKAQGNSVKVIILNKNIDSKYLPEDLDTYIFAGSGSLNEGKN
jgi:uncharacterized protein (DUF58 family)